MYLVIAEDPFDRERAIRSLGGDPEVLEEPHRLPEELSSPSLFGGERTLLVRNADQLSKTLLDRLSPSPFVKVIFEAEKLASKSPLRKLATQVIEVPTPPPWERERHLIDWLTEGGKIERAAAQQLVARVGHDKRLLMRELEKLSTYTGGKMVDATAVEAVAVGFPHETVWELGRAVMARDGRRALAIWRQLSAGGVVPLALLPVLRSQMQTGFRICQMLSFGGHPNEKPRRIAEAKSYGLAAFRSALVAIFDTELACKNGADEGAIVRLLGRLC